MMDGNDQKSTRERVLDTLLTNKQCTINELADAVDINPISVRHHITKLEADGLVDSAEERHGVGRPRRVYYLTEQGLEQFPTRYVRLTVRLLEQLKETLPEEMVQKIFSAMARDVAEDYREEYENLAMEDRLNALQDLLHKEGFNVDWEKQGDSYLIRETSCPYYRVGQDHPEVCAVDQTLISAVLDVPAEKVGCMLNGDQLCTYVVTVQPENVERISPEEIKTTEKIKA